MSGRGVVVGELVKRRLMSRDWPYWRVLRGRASCIVSGEEGSGVGGCWSTDSPVVSSRPREAG